MHAGGNVVTSAGASATVESSVRTARRGTALATELNERSVRGRPHPRQAHPRQALCTRLIADTSSATDKATPGSPAIQGHERLQRSRSASGRVHDVSQALAGRGLARGTTISIDVTTVEDFARGPAQRRIDTPAERLYHRVMTIRTADHVERTSWRAAARHGMPSTDKERKRTEREWPVCMTQPGRTKRDTMTRIASQPMSSPAVTAPCISRIRMDSWIAWADVREGASHA